MDSRHGRSRTYRASAPALPVIVVAPPRYTTLWDATQQPAYYKTCARECLRG